MDKYCRKTPELQKKSQLDEKTIALIKQMVRDELIKRLAHIENCSWESLIKGDYDG